MSLINIKYKYLNLLNEIENTLDEEIKPVLELFKNDFLIPISKDKENFIDLFFQYFSDESETVDDIINNVTNHVGSCLKKSIKDKSFESFDHGVDIEIYYIDSDYLVINIERSRVSNCYSYKDFPTKEQKTKKEIYKEKELIFNLNVKNINICKNKKTKISI